MSFLKEVFGPKSLIADVRATIIGMMTGGAVLFFGSIGGAIWKSVKEQPIPWTFLILIGVAGISLLLAATIKLVKSGTPEQPQPVGQNTPIAPIFADSEPMIPPTPDFSDPAYDQMFLRMSLSDWREWLIKSGQLLLEQWTTRLNYPEKQRRENDSKNWLCEVGEFAGKYLTKEQMDEFVLRHGNAASGSKKYEFGQALIQAGTQSSDEDRNLAFEIFGKVKLLERFRSDPIPPLIPCEQVTRGEIPQPKEPKVEKVVDGASALLEKIDHLHPLNAIVKAGAANLQSNADVVEVNRQIAGRNYSAPFNEAIREKDYLEFLRFCGKQKLPLGIDTEIYQAAKQFYTGTLENPKIANLKQQLAKKIAKGKRIEEEWPESRDRDESMRRNQRFINELLAEIKRLENEQS